MDLYFIYENEDVVKIAVSYSGFGCGGGPFTDYSIFYIEDTDSKISSLSEKEFMKKIIEKV